MRRARLKLRELETHFIRKVRGLPRTEDKAGIELEAERF